MYKIEIYSKFWPSLFRGRRQWYWRLRYTNNMINQVVATGGEGYFNLSDLENSLKNIILHFGDATWEYSK